MRPASIGDTELVDALGDVFSRYGVEGASLSRLSEASGLKRASLYHRFPGGKDEIVTAVVDRTAERFNRALAQAYAEGAPAERAMQVADGIDDYYEQGARSCLIVALSVSDDESRSGGLQCVDAWAKAFEKIAGDAGLKPKQAREAAIDAVAAIEGALVISTTTGDTGSFQRALASLPDRLTTKP